MKIDEVARGEKARATPRGLSALRPALYICIVIGIALAAFVTKRGAVGIFTCAPDGYSADRYLAYCQAEGYGDYEHGAFWFGLEPSIGKFLANANVVLLGNSRMQHAFSTNAAANWFASAAARYYLLGFAFFENSLFEGKLLEKYKPPARVYIINIDNFFDATETPPATFIMQDRTAVISYEIKRLWQWAHKPACTYLSAICNNGPALYRSRENGSWYIDVPEEDFGHRAVSYNDAVDQSFVTSYTAVGDAFLSDLPVKRACVILTLVASVGTNISAAQAIAHTLGVTFVAPRLDGLVTYDGSHLDFASAERWSTAFFEAAGPRIRDCLGSGQEAQP